MLRWSQYVQVARPNQWQMLPVSVVSACPSPNLSRNQMRPFSLLTWSMTLARRTKLCQVRSRCHRQENYPTHGRGSTLTRRLETLFKPRLQSREPRLGTTAVESVLALKLVGGLLSLRLRFLPGFHRAFQTEQHWVWVKTCENLVHLIRLHLDFFNQSSWIARTYSLSNPATTGTPKQPTNNLLDEM